MTSNDELFDECFIWGLEHAIREHAKSRLHTFD